MKIWFGTTTAKLEEYKDQYFAIRDYLKQKGHVVLFDWLDKAWAYRVRNFKGQRDVKKIFNEVIGAIDECDCVIIEFTVPNFSSSHQITYALFRNKPTLVLRQKRDNQYADSYIEALDSKLLTLKNYSFKDYKEVIDEFLSFVNMGDNQGRYNVVLGTKQKHFLDWASSKYQKSRSEIIRSAVNEVIKNDLDYKKYLKL